jgi:hypothetical protein
VLSREINLILKSSVLSLTLFGRFKFIVFTANLFFAIFFIPEPAVAAVAAVAASQLWQLG